MADSFADGSITNVQGDPSLKRKIEEDDVKDVKRQRAILDDDGDAKADEVNGDNNDDEDQDEKSQEVIKCIKCSTLIEKEEGVELCDDCEAVYEEERRKERDLSEEEDLKQEEARIIKKLWVYIPTDIISGDFDVTLQDDQVLPYFESLQAVRRYWANTVKLDASDDAISKLVDTMWDNEKYDAPRFNTVVLRKDDEEGLLNGLIKTLYVRIPELDNVRDASYEEGDELGFSTSLDKAIKSWWQDYGFAKYCRYRCWQNKYFNPCEAQTLTDDEILACFNEMRVEDRPRFVRIVL